GGRADARRDRRFAGLLWAARPPAPRKLAAPQYRPRAAPRSCGGAGSPRPEPRLDRVPDRLFQLLAVEPVDLLDARWRGHVDLGEEFADHIDADEDQPLVLEHGTERPADLARAPRQLGFHCLAPH